MRELEDDLREAETKLSKLKQKKADNSQFDELNKLLQQQMDQIQQLNKQQRNEKFEFENKKGELQMEVNRLNALLASHEKELNGNQSYLKNLKENQGEQIQKL